MCIDSAATAALLAVSSMGLDTIQAEDFTHGFKHGASGQETYADWWNDQKHYIDGFNAGTAWLKEMSKKEKGAA